MKSCEVCGILKLRSRVRKICQPGRITHIPVLPFFIGNGTLDVGYDRYGILQMKNVILAGLLVIISPVIAQDCFDMAGRDYHIEPDLLRAISFRESSWCPDAMNVVSNQSYAVGMMQIHSQNFSHLSQHGITAGNLYRDPCMNIYTGAYYLAIAFKRWGYSWRAVGAYNAGFRETEAQERKRQKYAEEIRAIYNEIKKNASPE